MQYCVPRVKSKNKYKFFKIFILFVLVVLLIFVVFMGFYLSSKRNRIFKEKTYYFVCAQKSKGIKELENMQDGVKNLGGAGKIYKKDNYNYLMIYVYDDGEFANSVVLQNKEVYANGIVLELKTNKINSKTKKLISSNDTYYKYVKKLNNDVENILKLSLNYLSGNINENSMCSKILTIKFELDDLNDLFKNEKFDEEKICNHIKNYINLEILYFASFFDDFIGSEKKSSILCEFAINLTLLYIDFFNNL